MWLLTSEFKGEVLRARYLDPDKLIRIGLYRWPHSSRWYIQTQDRDGEEKIVMDALPNREAGCGWLHRMIDAMPPRPWLVIDLGPNDRCEYLWLDPESDHHLVISRIPRSRRWELCSIAPDGMVETLVSGVSREHAEAMLRQGVNALAASDVAERVVDATGDRDGQEAMHRGRSV